VALHQRIWRSRRSLYQRWLKAASGGGWLAAAGGVNAPSNRRSGGSVCGESGCGLGGRKWRLASAAISASSRSHI